MNTSTGQSHCTVAPHSQQVNHPKPLDLSLSTIFSRDETRDTSGAKRIKLFVLFSPCLVQSVQSRPWALASGRVGEYKSCGMDEIIQASCQLLPGCQHAALRTNSINFNLKCLENEPFQTANSLEHPQTMNGWVVDLTPGVNFPASIGRDFNNQIMDPPSVRVLEDQSCFRQILSNFSKGLLLCTEHLTFRTHIFIVIKG